MLGVVEDFDLHLACLDGQDEADQLEQTKVDIGEHQPDVPIATLTATLVGHVVHLNTSSLHRQGRVKHVPQNFKLLAIQFNYYITTYICSHSIARVLSQDGVYSQLRYGNV